MNFLLKEWKGCDSFMPGMFFGHKSILDHFNTVLLISLVTLDGNIFYRSNKFSFGKLDGFTSRCSPKCHLFLLVSCLVSIVIWLSNDRTKISQ
jgi:hypothetical protein